MTGLGDVVLAAPPNWIAAAHPELGLTVVDGGAVSEGASDHLVFVRHLVPSLYFHQGTHGDDRLTDSPASVDADAAARVLRLVFYTAYQLANAETQPSWTSAGRRHAFEVRERSP